MGDEELRKLARIAQQEPTMENLAKLGMACLRHFPADPAPTASAPSVLRIAGRRWFQKNYGNTYHSVSVYLDEEHLGNSGVHYGYGDSYVSTGVALAVANSDLPEPLVGEPIWQWAQRIGIKLEHSASAVRRRADLS